MECTEKERRSNHSLPKIAKIVSNKLEELELRYGLGEVIEYVGTKTKIESQLEASNALQKVAGYLYCYEWVIALNVGVKESCTRGCCRLQIRPPSFERF